MPLPNILEFIGTNITQRKFQQAMEELLGFTDELDKRQAATANGYYKSYATLSAANADIANIPLGVSVKVLSMVDGGEYYKATSGASSLTKSPYDPLTIANEYARNITAPIVKTTEELSTIDTRLLNSIQVLMNAILQFRSDYDDESSTQNSTLADLVNADKSLQNDLLDTNTHISRQLVALQQLAYTVATNRDELDLALVAYANAAENKNTDLTNTMNIGLSDLRSNFQNLFLALSTLIPTVNMLNDDVAILADTSDEEPLKLSKLVNAQTFTLEMTKLDGFNPENTGVGKNVEIGSVVVLPTPTQAIRIDIETSQALPNSKGLTIRTITTINVDGQIFQSFGTIEVQGSSSALMPKKNWTLAFFNDDTRVNAINVKLGHMMPHDELVWKANFVDNTQTRNNVANRIWEEMVQSRRTFPKSEVDKVTIAGGVGLAYVPTGALGHVDGFPAVVYINNEFYGLGALNIGKKRGNYNLKSNDQKHIQIEPEGNVIINKLPTTPLEPATPNGTSAAFEIRRPSVWGEEAQGYYTRFRNFLSLSKNDMIAAGVDNYIDRRTAIDYFIFIQLLGLGDTFHKNTLYTTWNGLVWYFMPYDLDCTCGLNSNGKVEFSPTSLTIPNSDTTNSSTTDWWNNNFGTVYKLRSIYGADVDARYAELRKSVLSLDHLTDLHLQWAKAFTADMYAMENSKWNKGTDNLATSLIQSSSVWQIHDWISQHLPRCDTYFNYTAA